MNAAVLLMAACIPGAEPDSRAVVPYPLMSLVAALDAPIPCPSADAPAASVEVVPVGYRPVPPAPCPPAATVEPPLLVSVERVRAVEPVTMPVIEVKPPVAAVRGKLVVALPAAARLFIDGRPVEASMGENTFYTVPLPFGAARYYRLRGEVRCDGLALDETVTAVVEAGREAWVCFPRLQTVGERSRNEPLVACRPAAAGPPSATMLGFQQVGYPLAAEPVVATVRAKLIVTLPAGARLSIEDQPIQAVPGENVFDTPPLQAGAAYHYAVRAEIVRDGQVFGEEVQVVVRAGEQTRVSFAHLQPPPRVGVRWSGWR